MQLVLTLVFYVFLFAMLYLLWRIERHGAKREEKMELMTVEAIVKRVLAEERLRESQALAKELEAGKPHAPTS